MEQVHLISCPLHGYIIRDAPIREQERYHVECDGHIFETDTRNLPVYEVDLRHIPSTRTLDTEEVQQFIKDATCYKRSEWERKHRKSAAR